MGTIKVKYCDNCELEDNDQHPVRSYRWFRIQDHQYYKGQNLVKIDLCNICAGKVLGTLLMVIGKTDLDVFKEIPKSKHRVR